MNISKSDSEFRKAISKLSKSISDGLSLNKGEKQMKRMNSFGDVLTSAKTKMDRLVKKESGINLNRILSDEEINRLTEKDKERLKNKQIISKFNLSTVTGEAVLGSRDRDRRKKSRGFQNLPVIKQSKSLLEMIEDELNTNQSAGGFYRKEMKRLRKIIQ